MEQNIESLRLEFLRILQEVEKISKGDQDPKYDPSKYESCIKIDGRSILPPVMTEGKYLFWKIQSLDTYFNRKGKMILYVDLDLTGKKCVTKLNLSHRVIQNKYRFLSILCGYEVWT